MMVKATFFLISLLYLSPLLPKQGDNPFKFLDRETTKLESSVNVLTGEYYVTQDDLIVHGIEPIHLRRVYTSGNAQETDAGWVFFPHLKLQMKKIENSPYYEVIVSEPDGTIVTYKSENQSSKLSEYDFYPDLPEKVVGLRNNSHDQISARNNYRNNWIKVNLPEKKAYLYAADGSVRSYKYGSEGFEEEDESEESEEERNFHLDHIQKLNGNQVHFEYDRPLRISQIKTTNYAGTKIYASAQFSYKDNWSKNHDFVVTTSTGHRAEYNFWRNRRKRTRDHFWERKKPQEDSFHLSRVDSTQVPIEMYDYQPLHIVPDPQVAQMILVSGMNVELDYYHVGHNKLADGSEVHIPNEEDTRYNRIKNVSFPYGEKGGIKSFYTVKYAPGKRLEDETFDRDGLTHVIDFQGNQVVYRCTPHLQMKQIEYHDKEYGLQRTRKFYWGTGQNSKRLVCRAYANALDENLLAQHFEYDTFGNVIRETIYGNLSGLSKSPLLLDEEGFPTTDGIESFSKEYGYTEKYHLLEHETEENGLSKHYVYHPGTDLLICKFICDQGRPKIRYFYDYNEDGILIAESIDDGTSFDPQNGEGITERRFFRYSLRQEHPALGFPETIVESFYDFTQNRETLIRKKQFVYGENAKVIREDVYDDQDQLKYQIHTKYKSTDSVLSRTTPLGYVSRYKYDSNSNLVYRSEADSPMIYHYRYDEMNRLISSIEEDPKGQEHETRYEYDQYGKKVVSIDSRGNRINYAYDLRGNCIQVEYPLVKNEQGKVVHPATWHFFDCWSNPIKKESLNGNRVLIDYNSYHQPTRIIQADGTEQHKLYSPRGELLRLTDEKGSETHFKYDFLGRVIEKKVYSASQNLFSQENWEYNAFHLVSYTDASGCKAHYFYDGAGRKVREVMARGNEVREIQYGYDSLGNCSATRFFPNNRENSYLTERRVFDLEGNVIEQWNESANGDKSDHFAFSYDAYKNRTKVMRFTSLGALSSHHEYDEKNRLVKSVDPEAHVTLFAYHDEYINELDQLVTEKSTIFSNGDSQVEVYDIFDRVISLERQDPLAKTLKKEEYVYDLEGNKTAQLTYVFKDNQQIAVQKTLWDYGPNGELIRLTELANSSCPKVTEYQYDGYGNLIEVLKPNGVSVKSSYDPLNRLSEVSASDGSIHYRYSYNAAHQLTQITNLITGLFTHRIYDAFGNIIQEALESGKTIRRTYDALDRCTSVVLPNDESIEYTYDAFRLLEVARKSCTGSVLYSHQFTKFDDYGTPTSQELICNIGKVRTQTDTLGRVLEMRTPYSHYCVKAMDQYGYITHLVNIFSDTYYTYNEMHQLVLEKGLVSHNYGYDNQHNRVLKDAGSYEIDEFNQLLSTPKRAFAYDLNGNIVEQKDMPIHYGYTYDALDRLTVLKIRDIGEYHFGYDGFNRRISSQFIGYDEMQAENEELAYLFVGDIEIGSFNQDGMKNLKILSMQNPKMPSAPVAIELESTVYAPLLDLQGNVTHLVDVLSRKIVEMYHYTAFGELVIFDSKQKRISRSSVSNPWGYQSKRREPRIGLVDFGRRFYCPDLGRWFTPDPAGFLDGANLYQYVYNSPLYYLDQNGKSATAFTSPLFSGPLKLEALDTPIEGTICNSSCIDLTSPIKNVMKRTSTAFSSPGEKTVRDMVQSAERPQAFDYRMFSQGAPQ